MTLDKSANKNSRKAEAPESRSYEFDLRIDLLGEAIKNTRKEKKLTQEELGKLIGVQKSQISKLERNTKNVTLETIQKVFNALKTKIKFSIEIDPSSKP